MFKKLKIFIIKLKWLLFGGKPVKEVVKEINSVKGYSQAINPKPKKVFKISNSHYASTKRFNK